MFKSDYWGAGNLPSVKHNFTLVVVGIVIVSVLPTSTTIDPTEKNPFAPVPSIPAGGNIVYDCEKGLPKWAQTSGVGG